MPAYEAGRRRGRENDAIGANFSEEEAGLPELFAISACC